ASRLHGVEGRIGRGNDRHVGAFGDHPRLAEWDRVVAFGNGSVDVVKPAMFENTTGLSSSILAISRPLASCGVEGMTTLSPGTCANQACKLWECCGPWPQPRPMIIRSVIGTLDWPPNM